MMSSDRLSFSGEDGFTLLEVLIALVLSSVLMMAVGGLFVFAGQLRDEVKTTGAIERSLLDLRALRSALILWSTGFEAITLAGVSETGFTETRVSQGAATSEVSVALNAPSDTKPRSLEIQPPSAGQAASVDLSAFDGEAIEYLTLGGPGPDWVHASQLGDAKPRAIRLVLQKAQRRWFTMLWVDNGR